MKKYLNPVAILTLLSACAITQASPTPTVVDATTLTGKVMCGYQGWFNAAGDGAGRGYHHWSRSGNRRPCPGTITFDPWPGLSGFPIQIGAYHDAGAQMLYVAMFNEVDEGTAMFNCTNNPPTGTPFATFEGLPSDHYLKLTGQAAEKFARPHAPK